MKNSLFYDKLKKNIMMFSSMSSDYESVSLCDQQPKIQRYWTNANINRENLTL